MPGRIQADSTGFGTAVGSLSVRGSRVPSNAPSSHGDERVKGPGRTATDHPAFVAWTDVAEVLPREDAAMAVLPVDSQGVSPDVLESLDLESGCGAENVQRPLLRLLSLFVSIHSCLSAGCARTKVAKDVDGKLGLVAVFPVNDEATGLQKCDVLRVARRQMLCPPGVARCC